MNYRLKSSVRNRKSRVVIYVVLLLFFALVFLVHLVYPQFLYNLVGGIAYPFWKGEAALSRSYDEAFTSKDQLVSMNEELTRKIEELESHSFEYQVLNQQNKDLKEILGRTNVPKDGVVAHVLKRPPFSPYDTFIVDAGKVLGVAKGDRVFAHGNILVGEVSQVAQSHAQVRLFSTPGEQFEVRIATSSIDTIAYGKGAGNFEAIVPREARVTAGDMIIVPHISPIIFGVVEAIDGDAVQAFKRVLFRIPVNVFELNWVFIEHKEL